MKALGPISIDTILQNKRTSFLVLAVLVLLAAFGAQKLLVKGAKPNATIQAHADINGEIEEVIKRSFFLMNASKFEEAIVLLNEALRKYPNQEDVLLSLGMAHRRSKSYLQAEQVYQQALQANHECVECMNNLAVSLMMHGGVERAIGLLSIVTQKKPDYTEAHFNLAVAYEQTGQIKSAVNAYQRYLQLIPSNDSRQEPAMARERVRRLQEGL